jgi:probable HAF family extracellular repeat protein
MKLLANLSLWRSTAAVISILTIIAMMTTPAVFAQVTYWVTDLGTLGGSGSGSVTGPPATFPNRINNSGQIVGYSYTSNEVYHAFLYSGGKMTDLGTLGGNSSRASGINNNRQIVGISHVSGSMSHAFLYTILNTGGTMTDLQDTVDTLGGQQPGSSTAYAINNNGAIVGSSSGGPFLYSGGTVTLLSFDPSPYSRSINDSGQVVGIGIHGGVLKYSGGTVDLPSGFWPIAINNSGQIVGYGPAVTNETQASLYAGGTLTRLGTLPGGVSSNPCDINNNGQIVGFATTVGDAGDSEHAFLYSGGNMTDLNSLIASNSGWMLKWATAINDNGCIVGYGTNATGQSDAFLLTPIPQFPHRASATAVVTNGVVVNITVTDSGFGYTNPPMVLIQGGGGAAATATAVVSNGFVTSITITGGGMGYSGTPSIYVYSPFGLQVELLKAVQPSFTDLFLGTNYQLQVSSNMSSWTNQGSPFTATNPALAYPQYWNVDGWNQLFFRLQASP